MIDDIRLTTDADEIKEVLTFRDNWKLAGGENFSPDEFNPLDLPVLYVGWYYKSKIIGIACLHWFRDGVKIHPYFKVKTPKCRGFLREVVKMIKSKAYCEIPKRKELQNLAEKIGFKEIERGEKILMVANDELYR